MTATAPPPVATLSLTAARAIHLAAQGLLTPPARPATKADVLTVIERMGALQIDTIHVVARSPYFVLWSRLGDYDPVWLDELLAEGALFEYWAHAACFIPSTFYPHFRHRMLDQSRRWRSHAWIERNAEHVAQMLAHIRANGPVRSSDFERTDGRSSGWWDWKPEKEMLEHLHNAGELMIARRDKFQRLYDLRERIRPDWDDATLPPLDATQRDLILHAVRALGVATTRWVPDYFRMAVAPTTRQLRALAAEGALLRVTIDGLRGDAYVHTDHAETLATAQAEALIPSTTTLLMPFDPVIWDRTRARELFGFDYTIECYTPAPKRRYGYFTLPILHNGALVGRLDPKAHRTRGVFEVKALHLEPDVPVTDELVTGLAAALRACARWHRTPEVQVGTTYPAKLGPPLTAALDA